MPEHLPSSDDDRRVLEMFSIVAHELRNPLAVVQGYVALAQDLCSDRDGSDDVTEVMTQLARSVDVLSLLLDRLRDGWDADTGLQLRLEPTDLAVLLRNTVTDMARTIVPDHPVEVHGPTSVLVAADVPRIRQILFNLLSNARNYSPAGAPIVVRLSLREGYVEVDVRNHGHGIASERRERVFERFSRSDDTTGSGLGIGLWLSRAIARAHEGDLAALPTEGPGSRFVLTLPLAPSQESVPPTGFEPASPP